MGFEVKNKASTYLAERILMIRRREGDVHTYPKLELCSICNEAAFALALREFSRPSHY